MQKMAYSQKQLFLVIFHEQICQQLKTNIF